MAASNKAVETSEREALVRAFLECRGLIGRLVSRIVRPHDIEDIVQETFIRSYEAARKQTIRQPRSFMLRTARNLALNHVKKADNRLTQYLEDLSAPDVYLATDTLESHFESRERFVLFCRAVRRLPVQCRRAFILKKMYGLSQKEIAAHLGIRESTVEKHIAKGLLMCSDYMEAMGCPIDRQAHDRKIKTKAKSAS
ncbi:MAG TPA: RNA polymerase sigma factor [Gammaproteobacteria bacterium]|jgi:RNA polymerase sigma-70 factor (ECF subfamily)